MESSTETTTTAGLATSEATPSTTSLPARTTLSVVTSSAEQPGSSATATQNATGKDGKDLVQAL